MRKRIRLKTSEEKKKLSEFIRKYNQVADEVGVATINVDVGRDDFDFPWLEEEGHEGTVNKMLLCVCLCTLHGKPVTH